MRFIPALLVLSSALLSLVSPGFGAGQEIAARIGAMEIPSEELRDILRSLDPREQESLARDPALLKETVKLLLVQKVVLKEALAQQWDKQAAVARQLERIRDRALVDSYLQSVVKVPVDYPSDADLQAAYASNKASFLTSRQFRLAQIFLAVPAGADAPSFDRIRAKVDSVLKEARDPKTDFGALALKASEEKESAVKGGEIGWLSESQIQPAIRTVLAGLTAGGISEPVRLPDGWHILKLLETKEPAVPSFEELKPVLGQRLKEDRAKSERDAYLARLLEKNPVLIDELALSALLPPLPKKAP